MYDQDIVTVIWEVKQKLLEVLWLIHSLLWKVSFWKWLEYDQSGDLQTFKTQNPDTRQVIPMDPKNIKYYLQQYVYRLDNSWNGQMLLKI